MMVDCKVIWRADLVRLLRDVRTLDLAMFSYLWKYSSPLKTWYPCHNTKENGKRTGPKAMAQNKYSLTPDRSPWK